MRGQSRDPLKDRSKFRILGPLEVEGAPNLGGKRPRRLLLTLLLAPNETVSNERLIDAVWPDDPPETARHALQVYVSSLRKQIGQDRIATEPAGYRIAVADHELDALAFRTDPKTNLHLWRGRIESDDPAAAELTALKIEAELDAATTIPELERLAREHPQRERAHAQLMRALHEQGRHADALAAYTAAHEALDEVGLRPSAELSELQLKILRNERAHLPAPATPLVGRRREVDDVKRRLTGDTRLLTLTGPGGTGKTRIALQAATELAPHFPHGAVFVDLAPLQDPKHVPGQIEAAAGDLQDKTVLLLLDNFEQVDDAATHVSALLREAPGLRCLVTSRHPLDLYGEHVYAVEPLALWDEAVPLFVQRARAAGARLEPTHEVAALCEAHDRLPLALELLAARARRLRDLPARQQSLAATVQWSVDLLDAPLQQSFHALGVFAGGWDPEAAAAVGVPLAHRQALQAHSLIRATDMLTTIRAHTHPETPTKDRHADHYRALAEQADRELREGGDQPQILARLDQVHANLRAALDHRPGDVALAGALAAFWNVRGHAAEGLARLERALQQDALPEHRAKALAGASGLAWARGDHDRSQRLAAEALALYRDLDDTPGTVKALANLGYAASATGDLTSARAHYEEALGLADAPRDRAVALNCLTDLALRARELPRARELAVSARGASDDVESIAVATFNLGYVALLEGASDAASHLRDAAARFAALGDEETVALALDGLAMAIADRPDDAARLLGAAEARRAAVGAGSQFEDELRAHGAAQIRATARPEAFTEGAEADLADLLDAV